MPIDTSIYGMLGQGVTPIVSPIQRDMQALQLKHLAAQTNLATSQAQEQDLRSKDLATKQANLDAINKTLQGVTDPEERKARLYALGTPEAFAMHHKLVQDEFQTEKAGREAAIAQGLLDKQKMDAISGLTGSIMNLPP